IFWSVFFCLILFICINFSCLVFFVSLWAWGKSYTLCLGGFYGRVLGGGVFFFSGGFFVFFDYRGCVYVFGPVFGGLCL
ncbi:hypothetical protein ACQWKP_22885, partial [Salmonella enterica subsp. enterica serovar Infantis]